ncbi:MAG TPA: ETC complex I subunit [Lacipirellulaceae bacterium]|nr:ETC complex I subunit [Lacipirellulaceae bacterium]
MSAKEHCKEQVGVPQASLTPSTFPPDAVAVIYRPARSAMTSGRANTRMWKLRFERRSPPFIEPLMGWTGGDDTLTQVELTFPTAGAAIAYARRQGLAFVVHGLGEDTMAKFRATSTSDRRDRNRPSGRPWRLEWVERTLGLDTGRYPVGTDRALVNPAACFASPDEVLRDPKLSMEQKREILGRWALDAYLIEVAMTEGMPEGEPSRLDEVVDALIDLEDAENSASLAQAGHAHAANADRAAQAA